MNKTVILEKKFIIENEIEFKLLIIKLREFDILDNDNYLKENILVNSEINIIHKFVNEFELECYRHTVAEIQYDDATNRGLTYVSNDFYKECLEKYNKLTKEEEIDKILNLFIEKGYLNGCYLNGELIRTKNKKTKK